MPALPGDSPTRQLFDSAKQVLDQYTAQREDDIDQAVKADLNMRLVELAMQRQMVLALDRIELALLQRR